MPAGPQLRARGLIEVVYAGPASSWAERCLRRLAGYLGGNWELGAGGARLAVGALLV
jgi:hypothetical protein